MTWWNAMPHTGSYGSQTIVPPAWPSVDEELLASSAESFEEFGALVRDVIVPRLQAQMMALADAWDGAGSEAALREASAIIDEHDMCAAAAHEVANKLRNMESAVIKTKILVNANADSTQRDCEQNLLNDVETAPALNTARVAKGLSDNAQLVAVNSVELAGNIRVLGGRPGVDVKLPDGLAPLPRETFTSFDRMESTFAEPSSLNSGGNERGGNPQSAARVPEPAQGIHPSQLPAEHQPRAQAQSATAPPAAPTHAIGGGSSSAGGGASSGLSSSGGSPASASSMGSSSSGSGSPSAGGQAQVTPAAAAGGKAAADRSPAGGISPAPSPSLSAPAPAAQPAPAPTPSTSTTSAAGSSASTSPAVLGPSGTGFGGAAATVPAGGAPVAGPAPMPLGPPTTPAPAAPAAPGAAPAGAPYGPAVAQAPTQTSSAVGAAAAVPVSAARAERDAVAAASTAGALRRRNQGNDPAQLARRIAAALNVGNFDFGFHWVTALTIEGTILVANSYGIGYIPANVALPEGVRMVSADETIPAKTRAAWATYPILALQGWAQHHNERLRGVIATEDQFNGFDPGAARIVLQPEDIPDDGTMRGRTRLEVIAPDAAAKLAATRDDGLAALLPPAQTATEPPEVDWAMLWFEVCKPLMSSSTSRAEAHLEAFRSYADQAMALALHTAQTEPAIPAQRAAIADWVYWQHQSSLITEALGSAAL